MVIGVRTHGWRGSLPRDTDEARERIIDAAMRCIDRYGPQKTGLTDVAAELGVTRQTVYRYFPGTEELFVAVGHAATDSFLDQLAVHLAGVDDPAELVVEGMAYTLERLPHERYLGLLLVTGRAAAFARDVTSPVAFEFGRAMLARLPVDWGAIGYDDADLDGLVEITLRILQSLVADPGPRPRDGEQLRAFLHRWVAPAVRPAPSPKRRSRRSSPT